jgi:hypothetical protein
MMKAIQVTRLHKNRSFKFVDGKINKANFTARKDCRCVVAIPFPLHIIHITNHLGIDKWNKSLDIRVFHQSSSTSAIKAILSETLRAAHPEAWSVCRWAN